MTHLTAMFILFYELIVSLGAVAGLLKVIYDNNALTWEDWI